MFYNNKLLRGAVPIFDTGSYPRITSFTSYLEGVVKGNISNASVYMSSHSTDWIPQSWNE
jgi:hypothetical protein